MYMHTYMAAAAVALVAAAVVALAAAAKWNDLRRRREMTATMTNEK